MDPYFTVNTWLSTDTTDPSLADNSRMAPETGVNNSAFPVSLEQPQGAGGYRHDAPEPAIFPYRRSNEMAA